MAIARCWECDSPEAGVLGNWPIKSRMQDAACSAVFVELRLSTPAAPAEEALLRIKIVSCLSCCKPSLSPSLHLPAPSFGSQLQRV